MTSQVQLVFLYHPSADSRSSPFPDAFIKRLESLYQTSNCSIQIAHIRYGSLPSNAQETSKSEMGANLARYLSSSSSLALSPFVSSSTYWQQQQQQQQQQDLSTPDAPPSILLNVINSIKKPCSEALQDSLDDLLGSSNTPKSVEKPLTYLGCLADGLIAAIELFNRATPIAVSPLARYLVHLLPDTPPLDLNDTSFPHSNLESTHDRWGWLKAAQEVGKMGIWPSTHVLPTSPTAPPASLTPECEKVHKSILDELPSIYPSITDAPSILGGSYKKLGNVQGLLLSGLSDASATAAKASVAAGSMLGRKRERRSSGNSKSQKDRAREEDTDKGGAGNLQGSSGPVASAVTGGVRSEIDKTSVNKIMFLQQQQQMMMRNLAIAARQQQFKGPDQDSPARNRLLEQFRDQLLATQTALKAQIAILSSGGSVSNLSTSLTSLIAIDKDASEKGLHLGGPSGMQQTMMERQKQLLLQQQQQQHQIQQQQQLQSQQQPQTANVLPSEASNAVSGLTAPSVLAPVVGANNNSQKRSGNTQTFWNGVIMWSVALPNNTRNQAATFVAAHCAPNISKDTLMLPWSQKLSISEVQAINMPSLQAYAAKNSTSCILFQPLNIPNQRPQGNGAAPQQTNETMYMMLARMIDNKKSCAFIPLQGENCTPEAGIVIVPAPTQAGSTTRRLLGLIFSQAVPWHLFGGSGRQTPQQLSASTQQQQASQQQSQLLQQQQQQQSNVPQFASPVNLNAVPPQSSITSSIAGNTPQQALFQPQQQINLMPTSYPNAITPSSNQQQQQQQLQQLQQQQQLPSWARPAATPTPTTSFAPQQLSNAPISTTTGAFSSASVAPLPLSSTPADILATTGIDFNALANQFNFNGQQPQTQQQQQLQSTQQQQTAAPNFNANIFNNNIWNSNAASGNSIGIPPQQGGSTQGGAAPTYDMEALQRLLGLGST